MGGRPDSAKLWLNIGKCVMKIALSFSPSFQGVGVLGGFLGGLWARMEGGSRAVVQDGPAFCHLCSRMGRKVQTAFRGSICLFVCQAGRRQDF